MSKLRICSMNVRGLGNWKKRKDVFEKLRSSDAHIFLLQDVHCAAGREMIFRNSWGTDILIAPFTANARGVAILTNRTDIKFNDTIIDKGGNFIITHALIDQSFSLILASIYAPNRDRPEFFQPIERYLDEREGEIPVVLGGDWNMVLEQDMDSYNYRRLNNVRAQRRVLDMIKKYQLIDVFRERWNTTKRYTWRVKNPSVKQARLDFFLASGSINENIVGCDIKAGYRTDHSMIVLDLIVVDQIKGRGLYKFNLSLLKDREYVSMVKRNIKNSVLQYALPVYEREFLESSIGKPESLNICYCISDALLYETIMLNVRTETITYGISKKKQRLHKEKNIIREINELEVKCGDQPTASVVEELNIKQEELAEFRRPLIDGLIVRSRAKWYEKAERSSKYFLNLEKRNYTSKIIPALKNRDGVQITDQNMIIKILEDHFKNELRNHDSGEDPDGFLNGLGLAKVNEQEEKDLRKDISLDEVNIVLRKMKHNKSPGSDGFQPEFFKFFWGELKYFVLRMFRECFKQKGLPCTLRDGIITLLPKGSKPRDMISSYRPITLLNTCYKIISGVIANRLKQLIPKLVSSCQTGFIKGRFIGENTRLMSDVAAYVKQNRQTALFISLDIEGAFNSVSWSFIKAILRHQGFPGDFVQWFEILYEGSVARILYNGNLSGPIRLHRSCRQGDPLSCYLFLLVMECLTRMIQNNPQVKGVSIADFICKISCYCDDTLCMLDGSVNSCRALFDDLGVFAKYSGLAPNIEKTQAMWIGLNADRKEPICLDLQIQWVKKMKVLGIVFEENDERMCANNFDIKFGEMQKTLQQWSKRYLTVFGKITIIKSFLLPKFTHLFAALRTPSTEFIRKLNRALFHFLWNGKQDKLSRKSVCREPLKGGLGMPNISTYINALKVAWARKEITSTHMWTRLFAEMVSKDKFIWDRSEESLKKVAQKTKSVFWKEVLLAYGRFMTAFEVTDVMDISCCNIWYSDVTKFKKGEIRNWRKRGLATLNDLLDESGVLMNFSQLRDIYGISGTQLDYVGLKHSLPGHWLRANKVKLPAPVIHPAVSFLLSRRKGSRYLYAVIISDDLKEHRHRWEGLWEERYSDICWQDIYKNILEASSLSSYRSLHYKIITRIQVTNLLLYRMGISDSSYCTKCGNIRDTLEHKFWHCPNSRKFWDEIKSWLLRNRIITDGSVFTESSVLLGTSNNPLVNHIIICAKSIIKRGVGLQLEHLLCRLKEDKDTEKYISKINGTVDQHQKKWESVAEFQESILGEE